MSSKPFDKDIKKTCLCCEYGRKSDYADEIFCSKRGITNINDYCRKFKYDPLKRIPDRQLIEKEFIPDDFLI